MNALQQFIAARPFGFITDAELPKLIEMDRLSQLLVRCGGCRFICAAQDVAHLVKAVELAGDYVRDVAFLPGAIDAAAQWRAPEPARPRVVQRHLIPPTPKGCEMPEQRGRTFDTFDGEKSFDESVCGGAFDGFSVSSDADPGL